MDKQEGEKEEQSKGVRRPRSDAARRPRPPSGFPSAPSVDGLPVSHPSNDSYMEERSGHINGALDPSTERRPGDRYIDVMEVGGSRNDGVAEKKEHRKDDTFYSRHASKDHHSNPAMVGKQFGRGDRGHGEGFDGESKGGRDDYRAGRDMGKARVHDTRTIREDRAPGYGGNGIQDNGRESANEGGKRRDEGRAGRNEERMGKDEWRKFVPRREEYKDTKVVARKEHFIDRRFQSKDNAKQDRGEWRESSGTRRPDHERGKRLEKSMKDIVDIERPVIENKAEHHGDGWNYERNKSGRWREREDYDGGKERAHRDVSQTQRSEIRERHGSKETNFKPLEKERPEQKSGGFIKLKLKVGGVTHTFVSDSAKRADAAVPSGSSLLPRARETGGGGPNKRRRHRLILQDQSDDEEETVDVPPSKSLKKSSSFCPGSKGQAVPKTANGDKFSSFSRSGESLKAATPAEYPIAAVRKSSRVPKRRVLDGEDEDDEHAHLSQKTSSKVGWGAEEEEEEKEDFEADEVSSEEAGLTLGEESEEGLGDEDDEEQGVGMVKGGKLQNHTVQTKESAATVMALTARQRAMQTSKDADRESAPSLIEFPEGLTNPLARKGKHILSEAERQVKRVEAAHRRKQQVEKAAREIQATAIQKILGQDSTRKRRENRLEKQRQDIEEEKKAAELAPSSNSIRWTMGPSGSVVSFAEDVGLPSFFNSGPSRYPPAREQCAAPMCSNSFKYRDSSSNVPLCSLQCYRIIHHSLPIASTH